MCRKAAALCPKQTKGDCFVGKYSSLRITCHARGLCTVGDWFRVNYRNMTK